MKMVDRIRDRVDYMAAMAELQECVERAEVLLMLLREYDLVQLEGTARA